MPKTFSSSEQKMLLRESRANVRDHVILSIALGTGLRESEILGLDVGDVVSDEGVKRHVTLRVYKRSNKDAASQTLILSDTLRIKIKAFLRWKAKHGESVEGRAPLFLSQKGTRIADRTVRHNFAALQKSAGFERVLNFHSLRHTALTNLYQTTKDIRLVQRVARHANIESTCIYAAVSEEDILVAMNKVPC